MLVEIQTTTSCSATAVAKNSYFMVSGLTGNTQAVAIPFTQWPGANPASVKSFVFGSFSSTRTWEIGQTNLMCRAASGSSSSVIVTSSISSSTTSKVSVSASTSSSTARGACTDLLIDDWSSQSRLTFLFYNAMLLPSSDDGTMASMSLPMTA